MTQKIYIAGHTGLVGSALVRYFSKMANVELVRATHSELELTDSQAVTDFIQAKRPDVVILAAGKVGGIQSNSKFGADFIYQNIMIETNVIHASWQAGVKRLLNFGSSCVYPKQCPQPMHPDSLMTGKIESTNEPYAIAKLAGMSLCSSYNRQHATAYINVIPANLYGPGDTFDLERCHVVSALIRKFHEAKVKNLAQVTLWGSGRVERDFLFIDDLPPACFLLLESYFGNDPVNIGFGSGTTIQELAETIAATVGFKGDIVWDTASPDGSPARLLETSTIQKLGWKPTTSLKEGLQKTVQWFLEREI